MDILKALIDAEEIRLDRYVQLISPLYVLNVCRWAVVFHEEERSQPPTASTTEPIPEIVIFTFSHTTMPLATTVVL